MTVTEVLLKRFDSPDEVRTFANGKFEIVRIGSVSVGRATYGPGWRWSRDVGPVVKMPTCMVEHVGIVLSGRCVAAMDDGTITELKPGDLFFIPPGHDSWVVGDEPYVSLHLMGTENYAHGATAAETRS